MYPTTMVKYMISDKTLIYFLSIFFFFLIGENNTYSQDHPDYQELYKEYGEFPGVYLSREMNIEIQIKKGKPISRVKTAYSLFVLKNNSGYFNENKEYFNGSVDLNSIKAYTLYPVENQLKKEKVRDFKLATENSSGLYYDDNYSYLFNFPKVIKGSRLVCETDYTKTEPYFPFLFYFGDWLPAEKASLTISCPAEVKINYKIFGTDTSNIIFTKTNKGSTNFYQWTAKKLKDYSRDYIAPGIKHLMPHIIINIASCELNGKTIPVMSSVEDQYNWCFNKIKDINKQASEKIQELSDSLCMELTNEELKVKTIYKWVQKNIRYVAIEDGDNGYVPRPAELVLKRRYGDCKDKTSLLVGLMKAQNINAGFAWVGTRDLPYRYSDFPSLYADNHMIAIWWKSEDQPVILDGTTLYHNLYEIPAFIQGKECLISVDSSDFRIYEIPVALPHENLWTDSLFINIENETVQGKARASFYGENRANFLSKFTGRDTLKYPFILSSSLPRASNKMIIDKVLIDKTENNKSFSIEYEFNMPGYASENDSILYLNMNLNRYLRSLEIKEDRVMPVESEMKLLYRTLTILEIPESFKTEHIPGDSSWENPEFGFHIQYHVEENKIYMTNEIKINYLLLTGDEITEFRKMLMTLKKAYLNTITLKKL